MTTPSVPVLSGAFAGQRLHPRLWINESLETRVRGDSSESRILVIHVPKTGGTSLRKMLTGHISPEKTFLSTGRHQWTMKAQEDLRDCRLFVGHSFLEPLYLFPDDPWVTVLAAREPVAWWRSYYAYKKGMLITAGRDQHPIVQRTFDEWLASQGNQALSNPQASWLLARIRIMFDSSLPTNQLAATPLSRPLGGNEAAELLNRLASLITVLGTTNNLLDMYRDICRIMGWEPQHARALVENRSETPPQDLVLSQEQEERLRKLNRLDRHLYQLARRRREPT